MKYILPLILLLTSAAHAQQPDAAFLQRAIGAIQLQRNQALDAVAVAEAKLSQMSEDLEKARARIKELESKYEPPNGEAKKD